MATNQLAWRSGLLRGEGVWDDVENVVRFVEQTIRDSGAPDQPPPDRQSWTPPTHAASPPAKEERDGPLLREAWPL